MNSYEGIFNAKSIAVVGASNKADKTGHIVLKNLIDGGYSGKIYGINPKAQEILGCKCFPSLLDVPDTIDLAVIIIPAAFVKDVIEQCGEKGVKGVVIISGGFREIGNADLEAEMVQEAKKQGVRIIGPNCQGITYTPNNLCASWPLMDAKGEMAIISQSGTVGAAFAGWADDDRLGLSSFVSLGNKSDIDEIDLMQYFLTDRYTGAIGIYVEGVKDGRAFMKIGRETAAKKPVVILRPGRTEKGRAAAQSHTQSVAGDHQVFDAAVKQIGAIKAESVYDLYDFTKILALGGKPGGNRCVVLTSSGGSGIIATDVAENLGVDIVPLDENTKDALRGSLPSHCVVGNPLDLTGDTNAERYYTAVEQLKNNDYIDIILLIFGDPIPGAAEWAQRIKQETDKEVVACYLGGGKMQVEEMGRLHAVGVPVFPTPERAMRAINALVEYSTKKIHTDKR